MLASRVDLAGSIRSPDQAYPYGFDSANRLRDVEDAAVVDIGAFEFGLCRLAYRRTVRSSPGGGGRVSWSIRGRPPSGVVVHTATDVVEISSAKPLHGIFPRKPERALRSSCTFGPSTTPQAVTVGVWLVSRPFRAGTKR